jgi:hypothetical protein
VTWSPNKLLGSSSIFNQCTVWCEELPDVPGPDLPDVGGEEGECVSPVLLLAEEVRPLDEVNQPLPGHRLLALLSYLTFGEIEQE